MNFKTIYMTTLRPQTIQIFLPDGNPTSIKIADLTNQMMTAVLFPRNKLTEVGARAEVRKHGVYFLFGYDEEKAKPLALDPIIKLKTFGIMRL